MKGFLRIVILLLLPVLCQAQTYYPITHKSGTLPVGAIPVTVTGDGELLSGVGQVCDVGPFKLGNDSVQDYFNYQFAYPVNTLRFRGVNMGAGDTISFYINGTFYPLTAANISTSQSAQFCQTSTDLCSVNGGRLCPIITGGNSKAHIDFTPGFPINEIGIYFVGNPIQGMGLAFGLSYATEPHVYIKEPFTDTILCTNDTFNLPVFISDTFNAGNTFSVQLSDQNGSFSTPTVIGTRNARTGGNIRCTAPANLPDAMGYRVRVIADMPGDTSSANTFPLRLTHYPVVTITSNSPVCNGDTIRLHSTTDNAKQNWVGPSGFKSTEPHPSLMSEMKYLGDYKVTSDNYGCVTTASTNVQIKPVPVITSIKNNGPKCETENIVLQVNASDTASRFTWVGPNGFMANTASPVLTDVRIEAEGVYSAIATLDGCVSTADSTTLTIYPRPVTPVITVNNPVKPADSLLFHAEGGMGATYQWTGPAGFNNTEQNPIKRWVDINDEGTYTVVATMGVCSSSSSVSIDVLQDALDYYLTPNPNNGHIHIFGNYLTNKTIPFEIVSSMGQTVYSGEVVAGNKFLDMNLDVKDRFSNGVYFIRLQLKDKMLKIPFVMGQ